MRRFHVRVLGLLGCTATAAAVIGAGAALASSRDSSAISVGQTRTDSARPSGCPDADEDGVCDDRDNCPDTENEDQTDTDGDGPGDACDNCPAGSNPEQENADSDSIGDICDPCTDSDADGRGNPGFPANTCEPDNCPFESNSDQGDADGDGAGNACDTCLSIPNPDQSDVDKDALGDICDNCPGVFNPQVLVGKNLVQLDADGDLRGDACDQCTDVDGDGFGDATFPANVCTADNCVLIANPTQTDGDNDTRGDACDNCPEDANTDQEDTGDGVDGVGNACDNCPTTSNPSQSDLDEDTIGDICDPCTDSDEDGFGVPIPGSSVTLCSNDNCPEFANPGQENGDGDPFGDVCDNCPETPQSTQANSEGDFANFGRRFSISDELTAPATVHVADLDGDGDEDLLSTSAAEGIVVWFENLDGSSEFAEARTIATLPGASAVATGDFDDDDDLDLVIASSQLHRVEWRERRLSGVTFTLPANGVVPELILNATGVSAVVVADFNSDGRPDVAHASFSDGRVAWHPNEIPVFPTEENPDPPPPVRFGPVRQITTTANGARSLFAAEGNGDNFIDLVSTASLSDSVFFHRNLGPGQFNFSTTTITNSADGARFAVLADLNNDKLVDVLVSSSRDNTIAWHRRNSNDNAPDYTRFVLTTNAVDAQELHAFDADDDGDLDVVTASAGDNSVSWFENLGDDEFSSERVFSTLALGAVAVTSADIDDDEVPEVIAASAGDDTIGYFRFYPEGDRLGDACDICPANVDPDQEDFDDDGLGDACEFGVDLADIDGSGWIDGLDLALLARAFGSETGDSHYDASVDLDRNGEVDGLDLAILGPLFGRSSQ